MGIEIAKSFLERGAEVNLVLGPGTAEVNQPDIHVIDVTSADEMYDHCMNLFPNCHIAVLSAAVADYRPAKPSSRKIKKENSRLTIELEPTRDILASLGKQKVRNQFLAGFALETNNEEQNALKKLKNKNLDLIVLNSLNDKGAGFGTLTNKVCLYAKEGSKIDLPLDSKEVVAEKIVDQIVALTKSEKQ